MDRPDRPTITDAVADADTPRPYPRLTAAQKARVLAELAQEYALGHLRPSGLAGSATGPPEEQ
jgi:hypothetical protein